MSSTCLCNIIYSHYHIIPSESITISTCHWIHAFWVDWMKFNHVHVKNSIEDWDIFWILSFFKPKYVQHQPLSMSNPFYHVLIYGLSICLDLHLSEQFLFVFSLSSFDYTQIACCYVWCASVTLSLLQKWFISHRLEGIKCLFTV